MKLELLMKCICFQVTGLGTALKILFSGESMSADSIVTQDLKQKGEDQKFQLRRQEIVALFNAFGR